MKQLLTIITILFMFFGCSQKEVTVLKYEQKTDYLIKNIEPLHVKIKNFTSREFMPWAIASIRISKDKASWANFVYKKENKYYSENTLLWNFEDIKSIIKTTNFKNYNNDIKYALTTKNAQVRNLPTFKPFYLNPALAGEGFPFDYMQNTRLHVNTPLIISHYSSDGAWAFVQSPVSTGWLPSDSFAVLDAKKRNKFKNTEKIVITKDNTPIYTNKQEYLLHVKLGGQFALLQEDDKFFYSYMYTRFAKPIEVRIPKTKAHTLPLPFTKENLLHVSSELLGEHYGWGGFLQNRDCSAMTKDFFAPFGIWLPRNSASQRDSGEYLALTGWNYEEKEKMILKHGIAFLSLIYLNGHVMLYAGEFEGKAMVMHNMWGVKTQTGDKDGRYVIGKSIISDMYLGQELNSVKEEALLIAKVEGIVIKPQVPSFVQNSFVKAYPSIVKYKDNVLHFKNGDSLFYHDYTDKTYKQMLAYPSIKDTLSHTYDAFTPIKTPTQDAGRFRNEELLKKLYGKDKKSIEKNLLQVEWVDGTKLLFNQKQNAAKQLQKVVKELKKLPKKYDKFLNNIAGTFNYRTILKTNRLSSHSFGIAIDLNVKHSSYWKWDKTYAFRNKIPLEIVEIFERFGFIWGGRWYHYDTMHFEYRPELLGSID